MKEHILTNRMYTANMTDYLDQAWGDDELLEKLKSTPGVRDVCDGETVKILVDDSATDTSAITTLTSQYGRACTMFASKDLFMLSTK